MENELPGYVDRDNPRTEVEIEEGILPNTCSYGTIGDKRYD